jgi:hypothetical protein
MSAARRMIPVVAVTIALAVPALARATSFTGAVEYWSPITITVKGNTVTSIKGRGGGVHCASSTSADPVDIALANPVSIVAGKFHADGVGHSEWNTETTWSLDGTISVRQVVSGTVTTTVQLPTNEVCKNHYVFSAVVTPSTAKSPATSMYQPHLPAAASVRFDYRHGVITHLVVQATARCARSSTGFGATLDSVKYRLDPIQGNRGRFKIAADVLDDYGVVQHISMTGTILGKKAAGAISASRGNDINGQVESCTMHGNWSSETVSSAPPTATSGAFYDAFPYRYGRGGAWTYWIVARATSCAGGVKAVKFTIAGGASETVACGKYAKLGPLTPKRTYRIVAVAILATGKTQPLAESNLYLPGDDGHWIPIKLP